MGRLLRVLERCSSTPGIVAAWLLVPLVVATVYDVFARYIFGAPTTWAYEIGYMAMGTHFLLGSAYTLRERGHIRIDLVYGHVRPRTKAVIDLLGYVLLLLPFLTWTTWALGEYAFRSYLSGERSGQSAWNPIIWPYRAIYFLAFLCLTLQVVAEIIKSVRQLASGRESG